MHCRGIGTLNDLPTLIIDIDQGTAPLLADQLSRHGFPADVATSYAAAHAAFRTRHYGSVIFVSDLSEPEEFECVVRLRHVSCGTWIIVVSRGAPQGAEWALNHGADAVVEAPFSTEDVLLRLLALSLVARPRLSKIRCLRAIVIFRASVCKAARRT